MGKLRPPVDVETTVADIVTETNSAAIKAAVEIIDNFISGTKGLVTEDSAVAIKTAVEALTPTATTPVIYNVTMTSADTEYNQALPANVKKFLIHTRDGTAFRVAFITGKVATPTAPYFTVLTNDAYYEDDIKASVTLYFGCASAAKIAEIIAWS